MPSTPPRDVLVQSRLDVLRAFDFDRGLRLPRRIEMGRQATAHVPLRTVDVQPGSQHAGSHHVPPRHLVAVRQRVVPIPQHPHRRDAGLELELSSPHDGLARFGVPACGLEPFVHQRGPTGQQVRTRVVHQMDVRVDETGDERLSRGVDDGDARRNRLCGVTDLGDATVTDHDGNAAPHGTGASVPDRHVAEHDVPGHGSLDDAVQRVRVSGHEPAGDSPVRDSDGKADRQHDHERRQEDSNHHVR